MTEKTYGNMGSILRVDLTRAAFEIEDATKYYKDWIGGRALNHILLFRGVDVARVDPLSAENMMVISSGPLGGTTLPSCGRTQATFISPLNTSGWGDSNCGGHFGPALKTAGYDALVITGKSPRPVYLNIENEKVEFVPAADLWGKGAIDTQAFLTAKYGERAKAVCIGQGGENLVPYACIRTELTNSFGRTGGGCVFGSKNLKAVVVRGTRSVKLYKSKEFYELALRTRDTLMNTEFGKAHGLAYTVLSKYGTPGVTKLIGSTGMTPFKNWQQCGIDEKFDDLVTGWNDKWGQRRESCFGCPIHCHGTYAVNDGKYPTRGGGPEYESNNALGMKCNVTDARAVLKMNTMCNDYGLDTVETGNTFATLMELRDRGIIDRAFTDGVDLVFGNADAMIELLPKIAHKKGCGEKLAMGPYRLGLLLGEEAMKSVVHQKGMGPTGVDIRATVGTALQFSVSPRGAHHLTGLPTAEWVNIAPLSVHTSGGYQEAGDLMSYHPMAKARLVQYYENEFFIPDSLGICKFPYGHVPFWHDTPENLEFMYETITKALFFATGTPYTKEDLFRTAEKAYQIERATIAMRGIRRKDDMPNHKALTESCPGAHPVGPVPLPPIDKEKYEKVLDAYYEIRGWDSRGVPKSSHLTKLGLEEVARKQAAVLGSL